jgi:hypothetical protein
MQKLKNKLNLMASIVVIYVVKEKGNPLGNGTQVGLVASKSASI